jgi:hypothetical protein
MHIDLRKYQEIIAVTIRNNQGKPAEEIAERIVSGVEFAEQVMATAKPTQAPARLIVPVNGAPRSVSLTGGPQLELPPTEGAILISAEEPPPAFTAGYQEAAPKIEYWSVSGGGNKPSLHDALARLMPGSMKLQIPGIEFPVEIYRRLESPADHMGFVRVKYVQPQQEVGPEVVVSVTEPIELPVEKIKAEIIREAGMIYSGSLRKIVPNTVPTKVPSIDEMMRSSPGDTTDPVITEENRKDQHDILGTRREAYMEKHPG